MTSTLLLLGAVLFADLPNQDLASLGVAFRPVASWDDISREVKKDDISRPPTDKGAVVLKVQKKGAASRLLHDVKHTTLTNSLPR